MSDDVLEIRPVREEELAAVGELTARAYVVGNGLAADNPYLDQLRRAADRAGASPLLVAVRDGVVIGAVSICPYGTEWCEVAAPGEVELRMLVVEPTAFGTGVGDALARACIDWTREHDHHALVLSVVSDNVPAHRLYARHGFTRDPARDWTPVPGVDLQGYVLRLP